MGALSVLNVLLLAVIGVLASAMTAIVGFGGGTVLLVVLLLFMEPAAAIPFVGMVQLVSNGWRFYLFRRHIDWVVSLRLLVLMPVGAAVGIWFFQGLSKEVIQVLIGSFVLASLSARGLTPLQGKDLPLWSLVALGFILGLFNILVGVIGALLAVVVPRQGLDKEAAVGSMGFLAMSGHIFKLIAFGWAGFDYDAYLPAFFIMSLAVMVGGYAGKHILARVSERLFRFLLNLLLLLLSLKLMVWDGAVKLLG